MNDFFAFSFHLVEVFIVLSFFINSMRMERVQAMSLSKSEGENPLIEYSVDIIAAYVSNNVVVASDLPQILVNIHAALEQLVNGAEVEERALNLKPAVNPKKSVTPEYLICLEDGKKFKSLKRHLRTRYNLTPEAYREKWSLPVDYPMVAPKYAAARSALARRMGLGQKR